jgi:hypothetical protein
MKIRGHVHVHPMITETASRIAVTKTADVNAIRTVIGTGSDFHGAVVVVEGDGGVGGLVIMLMHSEIGRWRKEWDFSQTLTFLA